MEQFEPTVSQSTVSSPSPKTKLRSASSETLIVVQTYAEIWGGGLYTNKQIRSWTLCAFFRPLINSSLVFYAVYIYLYPSLSLYLYIYIYMCTLYIHYVYIIYIYIYIYMFLSLSLSLSLSLYIYI